MAAWMVRYGLFSMAAADGVMWMILVGIILHGICYDFFFVTGQIYIDQKARADLRAAAQGLITFITYGLGMFVGSWLSGFVVEHYALATPQAGVSYNWRSIWIFSTIISALVLLFFLFTFSEKENRAVPVQTEDPQLNSVIP
jgi:MFS family permease